MDGSGFALLIGLLLLGLAVWLLRRANSDSFVADATPDPSASHSSEAADWEWESAEDDDASAEFSEPADEPEDGDYTERAGSVDSADFADDADYAEPTEPVADAPETVPAPAHEPAPHPETDTSGEEPAVAREEEASSPLNFGGVRRRRRAWAAEHGFEYFKDEKTLAAQWPVDLLGITEPNPVAREVVSGYAHGLQTHIADVEGRTIVAVRREAYSPVSVHYSTTRAVPEGMRRIEPLDQPPFVAYTTDVRALDRMLDARVEDGLRALSQVSSEVIWDSNWVILQISRRLEVSVWDKILPHVRNLADAAMVLPPESLSIPLDMDLADQTRPMPGGPLTLEAKTLQLGSGVEAEKAAPSTAGGHLRAVPDAGTDPEPVADPVADALEADLIEEDGRPDITRPAEPVVFPSRSTGRSEGDPEDFAEFHVADAESESDGHLPRLGEDSEHISPSTARYSQVIRNDVEHEATIFEEYDSATVEETFVADSEIAEPAEGVYSAEVIDADSDEEALSHVSRLRRDTRVRTRGRHRAPDARHARPEPIEAVEVEDIETVDGEVVED